jgi:hypothetical protein
MPANESSRRQEQPTKPIAGQVPRWLILVGIMACLILGYVLLPIPSGDGSAWLLLVVGGVVVSAYVLIGFAATRRLMQVSRPMANGALLLLLMATIAVLGFAVVYLGLVAQDPDAFTQPLSKMTAAYFSVTILATVGFGDISAANDLSRAVVTAQMIIDLSLISLGVQLIRHSTQRAVTAHEKGDAAAAPD